MSDETRIADDDEAAIRYLVQHVRPGQWGRIARALALIEEHGGYGRLILVVQDAHIQGYPRAELSVGDGCNVDNS